MSKDEEAQSMEANQITVRLGDTQRQVVLGLLDGLSAKANLTKTGWVIEVSGLSFSELQAIARAAQQLLRYQRNRAKVCGCGCHAEGATR